MENFTPFNFERNGVYDGIDTRILNEAAKRAGASLKHIPRPWKRAIRDFELERSDALFQLSGNGDWLEKYYPVGPIRPNKRVLFVLNTSKHHSFGGFKSLKGARIGVISNFKYGEAFNEAVKKKIINPVYYNKPKAAARALKAGRIDGAIETYESFRFEASKSKFLPEIRALEPPITQNSRFIVFHRNETGIAKAKRLQKSLVGMHKDGSIKSIIENFR